MNIDFDALAKLPKHKALDAYVRLTSYEQQRATENALATLAMAQQDIDGFIVRRGATDALIDAEAKKIAAAKERLTQALAAPETEPNYPNDDSRRAAVRAMEARIEELQRTGAAHVEWLGALLANLDA